MTEETNQEQSTAPEKAALPATKQLLVASRAELGRVIAGQSEVIGEVLVAVLTQGHALLEGVPGIAKTLIVKSVGRLLGLGFQRVQGTPDLMPADILGTTIFRPGSDAFTFHAGPVFTDLLLVDEINRMPPRTQAALLECMEERQVTSDGVRRPLPAWFTVFATENPIDFEGTYPLPEAQLDRFLLKIKVGYPRLKMSVRCWSAITTAARTCLKTRKSSRSPRSFSLPRATRFAPSASSRISTATFSISSAAPASGPCWRSAQARARPSACCALRRPSPLSRIATTSFPTT